VLESERALERRFVDDARRSEKAPQGWPAALVMFHVGMWRERLHAALTALSEGRDYERPPKNVDEFNDDELPRGIGLALDTAAARSDHLLGEIIELYAKVGERPIEWNMSKTTTEAVLRAGYTHPRMHMADYHNANGSPKLARALFETSLDELRTIGAPPIVLGATLYNLAVARVAQGRRDEALDLIAEAFRLRPDIKSAAPQDPDLGDLRDDPRFEDLVKQSP
jgi:tetratricopeptide (TPR) repeat protein